MSAGRTPYGPIAFRLARCGRLFFTRLGAAPTSPSTFVLQSFRRCDTRFGFVEISPALSNGHPVHAVAAITSPGGRFR